MGKNDEEKRHNDIISMGIGHWAVGTNNHTTYTTPTTSFSYDNTVLTPSSSFHLPYLNAYQQSVFCCWSQPKDVVLLIIGCACTCITCSESRCLSILIVLRFTESLMLKLLALCSHPLASIWMKTTRNKQHHHCLSAVLVAFISIHIHIHPLFLLLIFPLVVTLLLLMISCPLLSVLFLCCLPLSTPTTD